MPVEEIADGLGEFEAVVGEGVIGVEHVVLQARHGISGVGGHHGIVVPRGGVMVSRPAVPMSRTGRSASFGASADRRHASPAAIISSTSAAPLVPFRGSRSSPNPSTYAARSAASSRQAAATEPKSNADTDATARTPGSPAAVVSAAKPPKLCPASASRSGSRRCAAAKPGSRTAATTRAASSSEVVHDQDPPTPQDPR